MLVSTLPRCKSGSFGFTEELSAAWEVIRLTVYVCASCSMGMLLRRLSAKQLGESTQYMSYFQGQVGLQYTVSSCVCALAYVGCWVGGCVVVSERVQG